MTTEAEARQKWCPFARPVSLNQGRWWSVFLPGDRDATQHSDGRVTNIEDHCIGSACMAWRRERTPQQAAHAKKKVPESSDAYGYCGLAGQE